MSNQMMVLESNNLIDFNAIARKVLSFSLGLVMTLALFYMMYSLIRNDSVPDAAKPTPLIPSVAMPIIDDAIIFPEEIKPVRPTVITKPTVTPYEPIKGEPGLTIPTIDPTILDPGKPPFSINLAAQSLPMVRFAPVYPQSATAKGIEGFVDVMFDVTETGATENIQIVYAEPAKIFNSAVMKAVSRWKYKPKMEDEVAMKMFGLRERIRFNLDK